METIFDNNSAGALVTSLAYLTLPQYDSVDFKEIPLDEILYERDNFLNILLNYTLEDHKKTIKLLNTKRFYKLPRSLQNTTRVYISTLEDAIKNNQTIKLRMNWREYLILQVK